MIERGVSYCGMQVITQFQTGEGIEFLEADADFADAVRRGGAAGISRFHAAPARQLDAGGSRLSRAAPMTSAWNGCSAFARSGGVLLAGTGHAVRRHHAAPRAAQSRSARDVAARSHRRGDRRMRARRLRLRRELERSARDCGRTSSCSISDPADGPRRPARHRLRAKGRRGLWTDGTWSAFHPTAAPRRS